jgi:hypothetical protein
MSDQIVQEAYSRVRSRYSDDVWYALPPRALTDAIYQEIRQIDAERLGGVGLGKPSNGQSAVAA